MKALSVSLLLLPCVASCDDGPSAPSAPEVAFIGAFPDPAHRLESLDGSRLISVPSGINFEFGNGGLVGLQLPRRTQVELTATPGPGALFVGWSGDTCDGSGLCVINLTTPMFVVASFAANPAQAPPYVFNVQFTRLLGATSLPRVFGTVRASAGGALIFACQVEDTSHPAECSDASAGIHTFGAPTAVEVSFEPANGMEFRGWYWRECVRGASSCSIRVDRHMTLWGRIEPPEPLGE